MFFFNVVLPQASGTGYVAINNLKKLVHENINIKELLQDFDNVFFVVKYVL